MLRLVLLTMMAVQAGSPPADPEIFLATLAVKGRTVEIGAPVNISNSPGYDNQPSFTPDGTAILFTSVRGEQKPDPKNPAATGSEIYRFDIGANRLSQLTHSPESEYSPTVTPDGAHISVIRVESDATQRLWRFPLDGSRAELVLRDVKPVGYHAWASAKTLVLFVLGGQGQPATLQVADVDSGSAKLVATNIGRSIQRIPGGGVSFVARTASADGQPATLTISELNPSTQQVTRLVDVPAGAAADVDTAWTPGGLLLVTVQGQLFGWRKGDAALAPLVDLSSLGLRSATRIAVSPKGDRLAIVAVTK